MGVALVTGAGKRLGRAMALALAGAGYDIAAHYARSRDEAQSLCDEVRAMGREARAFGADLTVEDDMQALVPAVARAFDAPLTVLVNNASIFEHDDIHSLSRQSWDRHLESNLRAPVVLTQGFAAQAPAPRTDAQGEPVAQAVVINMIDQRVRKLTPEFMSYTLAKMGLWAFTRTAAQALAPKVRVNAIGPGPTLQGARQSAGHFAAQRDSTVLQRGADPGDITRALLYLVEAQAVTGQLICVDGGQHLGWRTPDVLGLE